MRLAIAVMPRFATVSPQMQGTKHANMPHPIE